MLIIYTFVIDVEYELTAVMEDAIAILVNLIFALVVLQLMY